MMSAPCVTPYSELGGCSEKDKLTHGSFNLPYREAGQCAIPEPDTNTVVLTGSWVAGFGPGGLLADLLSLNQGRMDHATCGGYTAGDGSKVMLVAGGWLGGFGRESVTETWKPGWETATHPGSTPCPCLTR